ncbi:putative N-myristoyl transferase [Trypanosoma cruzi]|uniref:Glycylpeptide N-tetradecanoyltransferase n=3 Tax=Trypanosoma cruzi TaxID=5693 RepID=Q4DK26_TRYCC|nr:N-myristoyl transferase, putative [Trypanosoma cruzi]EAN92877.1 N-myristoyl transferase, putative [Trypanosoma cruzi]PWV21537.1 putative N-myristoyl transferase [Trypanosoma cruzi]RNC58958.1 n-myristoyl transferase [Trypanosoma cruzi]|eukprot:XP_814728.1 N-myristoyl transferase [Trypanosoma cruzi strain CL Brener]
MAEEGSGLHQFWNTQPVPQSSIDAADTVGPLEAAGTVDDVPTDPVAIASTLEWWSPDMDNKDDVRAIYELLRDNYVEDVESMFRFNYSEDFLRWALTPPGYHSSWHVAVRRKRDQMLMGFVSGIPVTMRMGAPKKVLQKNKTTEEKEQGPEEKNNDHKSQAEELYLEPRKICEINFLCVHKLLRAKRLAPILIKEVTRRVHLMNIWQAVYTAGRLLPTPFATADYYHRSLNPEKLVAVGFSAIPQQYQKFQNPLSMIKRFYELPAKPKTRGLRPMEPKDAPQVANLLRKKLATCDVAPVFTDEEVAHYTLPREGVLMSYVVEREVSGGGGGGRVDSSRGKQNDAGTQKQITDFFSFFSLPSSIIGSSKHSVLNAAYVFYSANTTISLVHLMSDLLIVAHQQGFDVCNVVNIMDNGDYLSELKFGRGDGNLHYYFYNWSYPIVQPSDVGLFML